MVVRKRMRIEVRWRKEQWRASGRGDNVRLELGIGEERGSSKGLGEKIMDEEGVMDGWSEDIM